MPIFIRAFGVLDHGKSLGFVKVGDLAFSHNPDDHYKGLGKIVNCT